MPIVVATAAPRRIPRNSGREVDEGERRDEDAQEDRQAAEARDRAQVDAALLVRLVDDAEDARDPPDRGREDEHDRERDEEAPQHVLVGHQVVPHGYFVP